MATYLEIRNLFVDSDLRNKVEVAISEAARIIASGEDNVAPFDQTTTPYDAHELRLRWAARALNSTGSERDRVLKVVLVKNKGLTVSQINGASDSAIQSNVNEVVDLLARGDSVT